MTREFQDGTAKIRKPTAQTFASAPAGPARGACEECETGFAAQHPTSLTFMWKRPLEETSKTNLAISFLCKAVPEILRSHEMYTQPVKLRCRGKSTSFQVRRKVRLFQQRKSTLSRDCSGWKLPHAAWDGFAS